MGRDPGIRNRKYNTYLILISSTEYKMKGHTIRVRLGAPFTQQLPSFPSLRGSSIREKTKEPVIHPPSPAQPSPPAWPGGSPSTHSSNNKTPSTLSSLMVDPSSPSGQSGPAGVARRVFSFLLRLMYCKPSINKQHV